MVGSIFRQISQVLLLACMTSSLAAWAEGEPFTKFGDYTVVHTVFTSDFVPPDVAKAYNLVRAKDRALVNVSIVKNNAGADMRGLAAEVSGTVVNLMQQQKALEFIEISESDAVYYLAPLRIHHEEVLHFNLTLQHDGKQYDVKFTKKLYID